jgi:hypothetical protein
VRINIVITGNDGNPARRPDAAKPGERCFVLRRKTEIDEVTRNDNVVGSKRMCVGDQTVRDLSKMDVTALPLPVEIA